MFLQALEIVVGGRLRRGFGARARDVVVVEADIAAGLELPVGDAEGVQRDERAELEPVVGAAGSTSVERNSVTASISSSASGRSGTFDQVEQLVLHFRRHPSEHRVLDAAVLSRQVPPRLRQAADPPT